MNEEDCIEDEYYWGRFRGEDKYRIARLDADGEWYICGIEVSFEYKDFLEIHSHIEMPKRYI